MLAHADVSRRVIIAPDPHRWVASPQAGIERVMAEA